MKKGGIMMRNTGIRFYPADEEAWSLNGFVSFSVSTLEAI